MDKVRRMAYEIFENYFEEKELILIGIASQGHLLAELLYKELKAIHPINYQVGSIHLNKKDPKSEDPVIQLQKGTALKNSCVILVDDVLNSGRTLAYSMTALLNEGPRKMQVCVLINRDHKVFPVAPDYIGLSLGTTLDEHVEVNLEKKGMEEAFLH